MTAAQRSSAAALLGKFGQTVTLTRRTAGAYNTANGTATVSETTQQAKAVIIDTSFGMRDFAGLRKMGDTNVPMGERQCYLAALKTDGVVLTKPEVDDYLTDTNLAKWAVVSVAELSPAGLDIVYELTVRAAL